jgi:hypothetical protein
VLGVLGLGGVTAGIIAASDHAGQVLPAVTVFGLGLAVFVARSPPPCSARVPRPVPARDLDLRALLGREHH